MAQVAYPHVSRKSHAIRPKRRWLRRLLFVLAVLGVVAGGGLIAVWVSAPPEPEPTAVKDIPHEWLAPSPVAEAGPAERAADGGDPRSDGPRGPDTAAHAHEGHLPPTHVPLAPYSSSGSLAYSARGGVLGQERYTLTIGSEGVSLSSTGHFTVRLLLLPVRVTFTQGAVLDGQFRPVSYALDVRAPVGRGRAIAAPVEGERVTMTRGDERSEVDLAPGPAVILGMFSSLAILPALVAGSPDGAAEFQVLLFGGPPSSGAGEGRTGPSAQPADRATVRIESLGERAILAGGNRIVVDAYRLRSALGDTLLLARGREFLGARMGEGSDALYVYRADYFPRGFVLLP